MNEEERDGKDVSETSVECICKGFMDSIQAMRQKGGMTVRESNLLDALERSIGNHFTECKSNCLSDTEKDDKGESDNAE